jgi:lipase
VRLNAHVWGPEDAPAVVCVHGVTAHGQRFRKLAEERLADRRVIAVDLRGHGHSGWEPPWNLETHVSDLAETAGAHGVRNATWIGFSFGGRLVSELALRDPWRVDRLVLLDPALQLPADYALEAAEDEQTVATFASEEDAVEARIAEGGLVSTPREILEEEMAQHLEPTIHGRLVKRYSRPAVIAAWGEMARTPGPPADLPTLFLAGTESLVPTESHIERYRAALGDDRLTVVKVYSGHNVLWDAFDDSAAAIARFVAGAG